MVRPRLAALILGLGILLFGAAMALRGHFDPWSTNAAVAVAALAAAMWQLRPNLPRLLRPTGRAALCAIGLGLAMVVATHIGFRLATALWPELGTRVALLYADIHRTSLSAAATVPLIVVVVLAEELLWRGLAFELALRRYPVGWASAVAVALYALPQVIAGTWLLMATAIAVGAVFTAQRHLTGTVTAPVITHAIWSVAIFGLLPLV